jgi:hypothetical protein
MMKSTALILILMLLAATASMGQLPATRPTATDRPAIERLIADLGSESWDTRESAHKRLIEIGRPAVRSLRAAARSDDPEIRMRAPIILKAINDAREVCVKELGKVPQPFKDVHLFVSPNGERVAYNLNLGGKQILVCDGKEGPAWDSILYVGPYSRDSKRLPYQAKKDGKAFIVFVGEEDTPLPVPEALLALYSPDGKRVAYWVRHGNEEWVVCDGNEGPHYRKVDIGGFSGFSPDGKRLIYTATDDQRSKFIVLDGQPLKGYEGVGYMAFSPDGKRLAFTARRDGNEMVVCDGKEGKPYPEVFYPIFSPDGKSLAYWARSADRKKYFVIRDEKEVAQLAGEPRLAFSPDGRQLACGTYFGGELYRFAEKVESLATGHDGTSQPVFSPDSRHIACALGKDMRWWICVDGKSVPGRYDPENVKCWDGPSSGGTSMSLEDSPGFSADGQHVYHKGFRGPPGNLPPGGREHFIVCDGIAGLSHEGLWIPEDFRNHAKRLRYVVRDGEHVRLMEIAWPEAMTWQDAVEQDKSSAQPATAPAAAASAL